MYVSLIFDAYELTIDFVCRNADEQEQNAMLAILEEVQAEMKAISRLACSIEQYILLTTSLLYTCSTEKSLISMQLLCYH